MEFVQSPIELLDEDVFAASLKEKLPSKVWAILEEGLKDYFHV